MLVLVGVESLRLGPLLLRMGVRQSVIPSSLLVVLLSLLVCGIDAAPAARAIVVCVGVWLRRWQYALLHLSGNR